MIFKAGSKSKVILIIGDIVIILFSFYFAFLIRMGKPIHSSEYGYKNVFLALLLLGIYLISFYIFGIYNIKENFRSIRFLTLLLGAMIFVVLISIALFYAVPFVLGRGIFLISLFLIGVLVAGWRLIFSSFIKLAVRQRNVLLVGEGDITGIIKNLTMEHPEYNIVGLLSDRDELDEVEGIDILGNRRALEKVAVDERIDDIVIVVDPAEDKELGMALINCRLRGINVLGLPSFYEQLTNKLPVSHIKEEWFLYSEGFSNLRNKVYKRLKRVLDFCISLFLLILILPLGLIIAAAIKFSSKGPVYFRQSRVGELGKPFILIKFRTMVADAENEGPKWAADKDPRVTAVGKIFRKTRLDELPQLVNVFLGDMSLIGPRPEREYFIEQLSKKIPYYSLRFSVKPGLTGWAQVNYRYGASPEDALEKLRYDLFYIKNMSLFLDFRILLRTIRVAIFGMGR